MKLEGDYRFDAKVKDVWDALFDPAVLAAALPGCEKLEKVDGQFVGEMKIKIGPVSGTFTGKVTLEDIDEPIRYSMIIDGRGNAGFVKARASVALAADGDGTILRYDASAQVGGKLASVGERLIDASTRAIVKQSLEGLHENVKIRAAAVAVAAAAIAAAPVAESPVSPAAEAPPAPAPAPEVVYKQVETSALAASVAKEVTRSLWPVFLVIGVVVIALVAWIFIL
jgi:carbon monoxide dehydrogenase subunit G